MVKEIQLNSHRTFYTKKLASGVVLCHLPLPQDPRLRLSATFKAGSRADPIGFEGTAHFLEHMMFRGSRQFPSFIALAERFENLGGDWNACTSHEYTEYSYDSSVDALPDCLGLFADFLSFPKMLDIEKERQVIVREIEDEINEFGHFTDTQIHLMELLGGGTPIAAPITGTIDSVQSITLDVLNEFRNRYYHAGNLAICVVGGDVGPEVIDQMESAFADYPISKTTNNLKPLSTKLSGPVCKLVEHSDNQYAVQLSFICEGEWSANSAKYGFLCRLLSDGFIAKLPLRLREQSGLVYDISAELCQLHELGTLDIHLGVATENLLRSVAEICQVLADFDVTTDELTRIKARAKMDLDLLAEDPEELALRMSWFQLCDRDPSLEKALKQVSDLTSQDLVLAAKNLFRPENSATVLIGPKDSGLEESVCQVIRDGLGNTAPS